jgi:hypothetical protein
LPNRKEDAVGYMHINNLYKEQDILLFKECYALEKIHGTSAHVSFKEGKLSFFSGGEPHEKFVALFDQAELAKRFAAIGENLEIVVFGEAYGGKCQGMSDTYGKALKFIAFDVKIGEWWLDVPNMADVAAKLGLEAVHYEKIPTDLASIDAQRDADSVQAVRNGMGTGKKREGVVLRPPIEVRKNNGERIISKHKREDFSERATPQKVLDPEKLAVLTVAKAIADEWVTEQRLTHVLDKMPKGIGMESTGDVIKAMIEDVQREAKGEIVESKEARAAIGKATAEMFKKRFKAALQVAAAGL